jgi:FAD:protein FMN transferase
MPSVLTERRFRAMNTGVAAWFWGEARVAERWLAEVEAFFGEVEAELSRFRLDSGLSRLNGAAGAGPQRVSGMLQRVVTLALSEAAATGGVFDPTVLTALQAAGYDRSFEQVARSMPGDPAGPRSGPDWRKVEVNPILGTVALPEGMGIDLGGIGKGWTVDRAAEMLAPWGAALVDAGGDIRATAPPGGRPWPVAIANPFAEDQDLALVQSSEGAVVTSTIGRRQWQAGGVLQHHLIDPRTGRPSESDLHTVTVLGPLAADAEVAAKTALILGRTAGRDYLEKAGLSALLIGRDGALERVGRLPEVEVYVPEGTKCV